MTVKVKTRQVMPENVVMAILEDFCGGYTLPSLNCWQMLSRKRNKHVDGVGESVPMYSEKK